MELHTSFTKEDAAKIEKLFGQLVEIQSDTSSVKENDISEFIYSWLSDLSYFKMHENLLGRTLIPDDPFGRSVIWALLKGTSEETIILMNHHDAIDIEEYDDLKSIALKPKALREKLMERKLTKEVLEDLQNDDWIFGRGTADMKSGIAIQMWLLSKLSREEKLKGNILFVSVCDEENLSAGMREAVKILSNLKSNYQLDYKCAINSEPYIKKENEAPIYYEGSVGKVMPVIFARGKKSHIGEVYSGLNPTFLLSRIHMDIEVNLKFSDCVEGEISPPPTWVYYRDQKLNYDASLPEAAVGYFSVLTLTTPPSEVLKKVKDICYDSFLYCTEHVKKSYQSAVNISQYSIESPEFIPRVLAYQELYQMLSEQLGKSFICGIKDHTMKLKSAIKSGEITLQDATIAIIEKTISYLPDQEPIIVIAFSGPLYPHVCNLDLRNNVSEAFNSIINNFTTEKWGVEFKKRNYFMGISDFSYTSFLMGDAEISSIESNTPGWGELYHIPLEQLKELKMELVNFGPWGKDLHKVTERVSKLDVFNRIPQLMEYFVKQQLK
ncbi:M20/M25/M40 family metallo-hydrolase [Wukongibacter baidiensis]|uniref:M20/M25/M40 family metallo-hydrolase n=1 Tax=Wukongibacter baidiensis TaxID=1723361 RepID=UPI003D7F79A5